MNHQDVRLNQKVMSHLLSSWGKWNPLISLRRMSIIKYTALFFSIVNEINSKAQWDKTSFKSLRSLSFWILWVFPFVQFYSKTKKSIKPCYFYLLWFLRDNAIDLKKMYSIMSLYCFIYIIISIGILPFCSRYLFTLGVTDLKQILKTNCISASWDWRFDHWVC